MSEFNSRTELLVGKEGMERLKNARVLVVGLGGVGGYIVEALVRAGVGTVGLCDFDKVDVTNINRQILATSLNIGQSKVEAASDRIKAINPDCDIKPFDFCLNSDKLTELEISSWDFIADAIDDVKAKIALIQAANEENVPIICSMGTGNKVNPFGYKITTIDKTEGDPLARSMRRQLRELGITKTPVLFSNEPPKTEILKGSPIPTISYMPAVAGLEIASYIISELLK